MNSRPIDSRKAGESNEKLILRLLSSHGSLSQTQLCRLTGLGSSTASSIVSRLRDKGLILESEGESTKRGPKPVILSVNPMSRVIVGVEINPDFVHLGLFDFNRSLLSTLKVRLNGDHSVNRVIDLLTGHLPALLEDQHVAEDQVLGMGVALSGTISNNGQVVLSSPMGWKNVPLRSRLLKHLQYPVSLFSTRVRLLAEMSVEPNAQYRNVVYINIADGVGCSAIIDGQLLLGASGRSGEIGHVVVDPDGPPCGCGHRGCLETFISGPALAERIVGEVQSESGSWLKENLAPGDNHKVVIEKWGQAIAQSDAYALRVKDDMAGHVGRATAMAVNLYDPEDVILAGYVSVACFNAIRKTLDAYIDSNVYNSDSREISIRLAQVGDQSLMIGAAMAIWQQEIG